ncbi:GNAT family N-acetyltransferase [Nocardia asteroides]|uniref:GNAT family N-acetyltransferase n=1 Tax=Nocardia asteroides TaxID=1824 RepID=UPI001E5BA00C|nr:GNAT family N-acetyltransferase [Nocardia asteroides]UGT61621.1 GNAT family N-acetyltransferase [Nocardia asteroides]
MDTTALDDPVGGSLHGNHAHLARRVGRAATYLPDVAGFAAVDPGDGGEWDDLTRLLGPGADADLFSCPVRPPAQWTEFFRLVGRQLILPGALAETPKVAEVIELGAPDAAEMLDLVETTRPGPFRPRTHELGPYLGIRGADGLLLAMAGVRLRPPGWSEISAVCTAPEARGRGYAAQLIGELVARITALGDRAFLHVAETNTGAIALYERLGFRTRTPVTFRGFSIPFPPAHPG